MAWSDSVQPRGNAAMRRDRYAAVGFGGAGGAGAVASLVTSHMKVASCLRVGRRGQARAAGRSRGRSAAPRSKTKTGVGYSSILVPSGGTCQECVSLNGIVGDRFPPQPRTLKRRSTVRSVFRKTWSPLRR